MLKQNTLKGSFSLYGKGLHTGLSLTVTFNPAPENTGYKIQRIDLEGQPIIDAIAENVVDTQRGTVLAKGEARVSTVEHAMAALYIKGIDNCLIQVNGPEFPILDGSAEQYIEAINRIGIQEQTAVKDVYYIRKKVEFKDEETGEALSIERRDILDPDLSDEERQLIKAIAANIPNLTDDELHQFREEIMPFDCKTIDLIYIERVRRGDERCAQAIEDVPTLFELCEKGNRWAAYALFQKYYWGDEKQGIFINRQKAKEYYDMAGEIPYKDKWDDSDDPGEPNPSTYEYVLTGNTTSLDAVETLIRDLCKRFGIPENEEDGLGLYVPQRALMKVLVGSDTEYYRGNILYLNREAPDHLVITSEADNGDPLLYALRQAFTNLDVEIKETEW